MTAPSTANPSAFPPSSYPIGTPGQAWGPAEQSQWRARQVRQRSYANDVLAVFEPLGRVITTGPTLTNVNDYRAVLVV